MLMAKNKYKLNHIIFIEIKLLIISVYPHVLGSAEIW